MFFLQLTHMGVINKFIKMQKNCVTSDVCPLFFAPEYVLLSVYCIVLCIGSGAGRLSIVLSDCVDVDIVSLSRGPGPVLLGLWVLGGCRQPLPSHSLTAGGRHTTHQPQQPAAETQSKVTY